MKSRSPWLLLGLAVAAGAAFATGPRFLHADLSGDEEVPVVSTPGKGQLRLLVYPGGNTIGYELSYSGLQADVTQAHIHSASRRSTAPSRCSCAPTFNNGPADTQTCPARTGTISGLIDTASVIGPDAQGIAPGQIDRLIDALRERLTYVNVHTTRSPGGEIRGQIGNGRGGHHH